MEEGRHSSVGFVACETLTVMTDEVMKNLSLLSLLTATATQLLPGNLSNNQYQRQQPEVDRTAKGPRRLTEQRKKERKKEREKEVIDAGA